MVRSRTGSGVTRLRSSDDRALHPPRHDGAPIRIGVSACLLGRAVRWDGRHKRDAFLSEELARFVTWVPVCPEVEVGMGVPRESVRLVRSDPAGPVRMVAERSGTDWTERMQAWARRRVRELEALDLCGYVLKRNSPSCGLERVRLWDERGASRRRGRGLFAEALLAAAPALPIEEEGRLGDPALREHWLERVFAYRRLRALFAGRWRRADLVTFHTAHELQLLAHAPRLARELGRLVAEAPARPPAALRARYERLFMEALRRRATPRREADVLERVLARLGSRLDAAERRALRARLDDYRRGLAPWIAPAARIREHVRRLGDPYLAAQVYLDPHPHERVLRRR